MDQEKIRRMEDHYQHKIMDLEAQKDELQASLRRMEGTLERGESARDELAKKSRQNEQIAKELDRLEEERDVNRATIQKLNAKINDLNEEK